MRRVTVASLALLLLTGCAGFRLAGVRAELNRAEARWQQAAIEDYAFAFRWVCFCPFEQVTITVRGGVVESVVPLEPDQPVFDPSRYGPVEDLFAFVRDAIDRRAAEIVAEYDPMTGVPRSAAVDYLRYAVDDEIGFVLEGFTELATNASPDP